MENRASVGNIKFNPKTSIDEIIKEFGLPSVIANNEFDKFRLIKSDKGAYVPAHFLNLESQEGLRGVKYLDREKQIIETKFDRLVPAYIANQLGFNFPGKYFLNQFFYPGLLEAGIIPLDPFISCAEGVDFRLLLDGEKKVKENKKLWREELNRRIGPINYGILIPYSKMFIMIGDGSHSYDDGASSETGYSGQRPLEKFIIRSDLRGAENPGCMAGNIAVDCMADLVITGPDAYQEALKQLKLRADNIRESHKI